MGALIIRGGNPLQGTVHISGRKNSAVAILPAMLLTQQRSVIEDIPQIQDVDVYIRLMKSLGAEVDRDRKGRVCVDPANFKSISPDPEDACRLRSSYYLLGVLLARFGQATVAMPGGCDIGLRPIDQHLKGLRALGAHIDIEQGLIKARANELKGATIYLDVTSVGATINIMLAASKAQGTTVIENAAKESHIVDVANCLNSMGCRIIGAGTDVIKIRGVESIQGTEYAIIPDEIEAATYMIAAVATRGSVVVTNVIPKHLDPITAKLKEMGANVVENGDKIEVSCQDRPGAVSIKTLPYPGFPTDAQQPMTALLTTANGTGLVTESVWESRFRHVEQLNRMGANIKVEGRTAIIEGINSLSGAEVKATDLRAGAAMVVAGLMASGQTRIVDIEHVYRGYEKLASKLTAIGGRVRAESD